MGRGSAYLNNAMMEYQDLKNGYDENGENGSDFSSHIKFYLTRVLKTNHVLEPDDSKTLRIPTSGVMLDELLVKKLRQQYKEAIRRRQRSYALSESRFISHVRNYSYYFCYGGSYIFGDYNNYSGIFTVTHFAPYTMKEGVSLIRQLSRANNIVFAVTNDLRDMLERLGFQDLGIEVPRYFGSEIVMKHILVSDPCYVFQHLDVIIQSYDLDDD